MQVAGVAYAWREIDVFVHPVSLVFGIFVVVGIVVYYCTDNLVFVFFVVVVGFVDLVYLVSVDFVNFVEFVDFVVFGSLSQIESPAPSSVLKPFE